MRVVVLLAAVAAGAGSLPAVAQQAAPPPVAIVNPGTAPAAAAPATPAVEAASPAEPATAKAAAAPKAEIAAKPRPPAPPAVVARINLTAQRLDVTIGGQHVHSWAISSGREGFPTPRGIYRPQWTARMWHSRKYDMAPMPHSVFFTGGVAVHATSATGLLGRPASHGCVRLAPSHAATFYGLVHKHGLRNVRIEVFGTPPAPSVASRRERPRLAGRGIAAGTPVSAYDYAWNRRAGGVQRSASVRHPGMIHLPPGSPLEGRDSFELNGIRYVRVR